MNNNTHFQSLSCPCFDQEYNLHFLPQFLKRFIPPFIRKTKEAATQTKVSLMNIIKRCCSYDCDRDVFKVSSKIFGHRTAAMQCTNYNNVCHVGKKVLHETRHAASEHSPFGL
jgi:hypothetical protein